MSCLKRALPECLAIAFAVGAVAILATAGAVGSPAAKSQRPPDMIKQSASLWSTTCAPSTRPSPPIPSSMDGTLP